MEKALNDIEAGLNEIPSTREDLDQLIADTREECAHARSHVEDSFRVVGE